MGQSPDLVVFLSLVQRTWQDFCDQMLIIRGIALLLDVKYVKNVANICSVWDMGLKLFCKHLSLSPEIEHKTVTGLLRLIESERYAYSDVLSHVVCITCLIVCVCVFFFWGWGWAKHGMMKICNACSDSLGNCSEIWVEWSTVKSTLIRLSAMYFILHYISKSNQFT